MTGKDLWAQYQHYTRDITEHGRKLGFAGAALCWVFKSQDFTFPFLVYLSLFFFVCYFLTDILHALSAALTLKFFTEHQEAKLWKETGSIEGEILKPRWVDRPAFVFFLLKCMLLCAAYGVLGVHLLVKLVTAK